MRRQYVHLSVDVETAVNVGSRKAGKPTILQVNAQDAYENGIAFYEGHDLVWLADFIGPLASVSRHADEEARKHQTHSKAAEHDRPFAPGSA